MLLTAPVHLSFSWTDTGCICRPGRRTDRTCPCRGTGWERFVIDVEELLAQAATDTSMFAGILEGEDAARWVSPLTWLSLGEVLTRAGEPADGWAEVHLRVVPAGFRDATGALVGHPHVPRIEITGGARRIDLLVLDEARGMLVLQWARQRGAGARGEAVYDVHPVADLSDAAARMVWALVDNGTRRTGVCGDQKLAVSLMHTPQRQVLAWVAEVGLLDADPDTQLTAARVAEAWHGIALPQLVDAVHATTTR